MIEDIFRLRVNRFSVDVPVSLSRRPGIVELMANVGLLRFS
jgi:hypothetical protein